VCIGASISNDALKSDPTPEDLRDMLLIKAKNEYHEDLYSVFKSPIAKLVKEPGFLTLWTFGHVEMLKNGWKSSRVTILGDAVHAMPPSMGLGGNTSFLDALYLVDELSKNHTDDIERISVFEKKMRKTGYKAIQLSMDATTNTTALNMLLMMVKSTFFIKMNFHKLKNSLK
jgi:hypothetical protein